MLVPSEPKWASFATIPIVRGKPAFKAKADQAHIMPAFYKSIVVIEFKVGSSALNSIILHRQTNMLALALLHLTGI